MDLVEASGRDKKKLVQLALDRDKAKPVFPMLWSEKLDGCFCIAWKDGGQIGIFSRTGERYTSMKHIEAELNNDMSDGDLVIFEAWTPNTVQATISGWCREQKEQRPQLQAWCHDYITIDEFTGKGERYQYTERHEALHGFIRPSIDGSIYILPQIRVDSMELALTLSEDVWAKGGEGGVLRSLSGLYGGTDGKCFGTKRSSDIIKIKKGVSFDLRVVGVYEGTGKYTGNLGGLECAWKDGGIINISGMTDAERSLWWSLPHTIIGKIVQVDAMCLSSKGLLREPRFKGVRTDKMEGDF